MLHQFYLSHWKWTWQMQQFSLMHTVNLHTGHILYTDRRNVSMLTRPLAQLVGNKANSTRLSGKVKVSLLRVCQTYLDSLGWEVLKGFSTHWFSFWNKVIVPSEEDKDLFFISMSPLVLNHRRSVPANPTAEIPGFADLSLLIDTKWSVSLLMKLWSQVVTIYFILNNFFQTVLPCLWRCVTRVLMESGVMGLKQRERGRAACHANTCDYQHLHYCTHYVITL